MRKISESFLRLSRNLVRYKIDESKVPHNWDNEWRNGDFCSGEQRWKQCKNCGAEKTLDDEVFRTIEPLYCTPRV